jgi:hypothetical protein
MYGFKMFTNSVEFWTPERSRLILRIVTVLQLFAVVLTYIHDTKSTKSIRRGDFPSFYMAAAIVESGQLDRLYDLKYQKQVENHYWPSLAGNITPFPYPPFVAYVLSPLAKFSPEKAQLIYLSFMLSFFVASILLIAPVLKRDSLDLLCLALLFAPVPGGIFSSQNTALSMFCYAGAVSFLAKDNKFVAGIFSGLWFFKPHFALIFSIAILFATGSRAFVLGLAIPCLLYYFLGTLLFGISWPLTWLEFLKIYNSLEHKLNSYHTVSLNGSFLPDWLSIAFSLLIFLYVLIKVAKNVDLIKFALILGPVIVTISPHTIYYDLGLSFFALAFLISPKNDREVSMLVLFLLAVLYASSNRSLFSVSPLILVAPITLACFIKSLQKKASNQQLS